jgi:hypothetical protein
MHKSTRRVIWVAGAVGALVLACSAGCSSERANGFDPNGGNGNDGKGGFGSGDGGTSGCTNLKCRQHDCDGGTPTTVTGKVYDPAGKNPLYNVVVYVPNGPLSPLPQGATCDSCKSLFSGYPLVVTTTNAAGEFTLTNVPDGPDVPLVVQVGKWRRQVTIPNVAQCGRTALPDKSVRLPKNGSEGDIPQIAVGTGSADSLECLLRRVGLDESEYVGGAGGTGHIHIFAGTSDVVPGLGSIPAPNTSPPAPNSSDALWSSTAELSKYDIVLLSCEGNETRGMNQQALFDYAASGGRIFASHFQYAWFNTGPFGEKNLATWKPGTNDLENIKGTIETTLSGGGPFPKGVALKEWLGNVGALDGSGDLPITDAKENATVTDAHVASQAWIKARDKPSATQYFTFNTPIGAKAEEQCGRVVYSDLHVGAASKDHNGSVNPTAPKLVPNGCKDVELSAQEKALEFMLFDLSSCVTPDDKAPEPPVTGVN